MTIMFQGLRGRLLLSYLIVMEAILIIFGAGIFLLFNRSLSRQLDTQLLALAEMVAPSLGDVYNKGDRYLNQVDKIPWHNLFDPQQQGIEWFDAQKRLLASQGSQQFSFEPRPGFSTLSETELASKAPVRTVTLFISIDRSTLHQPTLEGYVRISQSLQDLERLQRQLFWQLTIAIGLALGMVTLGGFWLTQRALEPIEQSFQQLKQFTADASHELRSPLTAIKASVEVMRNHPERVHPKDTKKLAAIASATEQMACLVRDLLFLARTEAQDVSREGEWMVISLHPLLQELLDWLEPLAQEKQISLNYQLWEQSAVIGDRSQLTRLLTNLLENALKYTPTGGQVVLHLSRQHRQALISVEDTGIGIAAEHIAFVFDRFWRADQARSRSEGGTGLGLSIAQAIAQRHRGKITVNSQLGRGSRFEVCLPLAENSNQ